MQNMNNLYGQNQVLGKGSLSKIQPIDNGMFSFTLPYNKTDFLAYSSNVASSKDLAQCSLFDLTDKNMDYECQLDPNNSTTLKDAKGKKVKLNDSYCNVRAICQNKVLADDIIEMNNNHTINTGQYIDSETNINVQTMNITNMSIGIIIMLGMTVSYIGGGGGK